MQFDLAWDALTVAEALVRAYQLLDGMPVLSRGDGFAVDGQKVGARSLAAWVGMRRYVTDRHDLNILRVWASCTAQRERVAPRYRAIGWPPKTAERRRRATLAAIAAGLNAEREMAASARA